MVEVIMRLFAPRVRTWTDLLVYFYFVLEPGKGRWLIGELLCIGAGIIGIVSTGVPNESQWQAWFLFSLGFAALLFSTFRTWIELSGCPRLIEEPLEGKLAELEKLRPSPDEDMDGFEVKHHDAIPNSVVLYSAQFNAYLLDHDFPVVNSKAGWATVLNHLRTYREPLGKILRFKCGESKKKDLFNESKIGVSSPVHSKIGGVRIFRGDYFSSLLTNEVGLSRFSSDVPHHEVIYPLEGEGAESMYIAQTRRLLPLGSYPFGNHMGANTLAVTRDGFLQLWRQSGRSQFSSGRIAPTGSGSCDWSDVTFPATIKEIAVSAMHRELCEESAKYMGKKAREIAKATMVIGYYRDICRGGKPGFLGLTRLNVERSFLRPDGKEVTGTSVHMLLYPAETMDSLLASVNKLLESNFDHLSVPLWLNLLALREFIENRPDDVHRFLYA